MFSTRGVGFAAVAVQRHSFPLATRSWSTSFPSSRLWNCTFLVICPTRPTKKFNRIICVILYIILLSRIRRHTRENIHAFRRETRLRKQFQYSRYNVKIIDSVCKNCSLNIARGITDIPQRIIKFFLVQNTQHNFIGNNKANVANFYCFLLKFQFFMVNGNFYFISVKRTDVHFLFDACTRRTRLTSTLKRYRRFFPTFLTFLRVTRIPYIFSLLERNAGKCTV